MLILLQLRPFIFLLLIDSCLKNSHILKFFLNFVGVFCHFIEQEDFSNKMKQKKAVNRFIPFL